MSVGLLTSKDRMIIITGIDVKSRGGIGTCVHKYSPWLRMRAATSVKSEFDKPDQTLSGRCPGPSSKASANVWAVSLLRNYGSHGLSQNQPCTPAWLWCKSQITSRLYFKTAPGHRLHAQRIGLVRQASERRSRPLVQPPQDQARWHKASESLPKWLMGMIGELS